jgi:hypothetical protein
MVLTIPWWRSMFVVLAATPPKLVSKTLRTTDNDAKGAPLLDLVSLKDQE